jgi:hypothetical protein
VFSKYCWLLRVDRRRHQLNILSSLEAAAVAAAGTHIPQGRQNMKDISAAVAVERVAIVLRLVLL